MFLDTLAATQLLWSLSALAFTTKLPLGLALAVLALAVFAEAARRAARRSGALLGDFVDSTGFSPPVAFAAAGDAGCAEGPAPRRGAPFSVLVARGALLAGGALGAVCIALSSRAPLVAVEAACALHAASCVVPCFGRAAYWRWRYCGERALVALAGGDAAAARSEEWFGSAADARACCAATARLRAGARVLVVGCGTSRVVEALARAVGGSGHVVATDVASAALAHGRARCAALANVTWRCADARDLRGLGAAAAIAADGGCGGAAAREFASSSFDLVLDKGTFAALECVSAAEGARGFAEAHRVLRPRGALVTLGLGFPSAELLERLRASRVAFDVEARFEIGRAPGVVAFALRPADFAAHEPWRYKNGELSWWNPSTPAFVARDGQCHREGSRGGSAC